MTDPARWGLPDLAARTSSAQPSTSRDAAMPTADHARWPRAEHLAQTIAFLVSPANALTSGTVVPVYGRA